MSPNVVNRPRQRINSGSFSSASYRLLRHPIGLLVALFLVLLGGIPPATAKRVSGDFRLTGANTEHVLTTFAVVPTGGAVLRLNLTAAFMYEDERLLHLHLYRDVEWPAVTKATLCSHKMRYSQQRQAVSFEYIDKEWKTAQPMHVILLNQESSLQERHRRPMDIVYATRPQYWYIVVSDCYLEQGNRDAKVPPIHFDLEILNQLESDTSKTPRLSHFSADEMWLYRYHGWTLLFSGSVMIWLLATILRQVTRNASSANNSLHVTILWVTLAALLDTASALLELTHLLIYENNGVGSYFLDAMSAHAEAIADALGAILLWCVGAGWTLSAELQQRALQGVGETLPIARLYDDWRQPFGHMTGNRARWGAGHICMAFVLAQHVILAQWGRVYNDNFDSYHDYEHGPGRALMWLRLLAGVLFALCTWHTHQGLQSHAAGQMLSNFYKTLLACGGVWYAGLPLLTWCVKALPFYLRNGVVVVGSSLLQAGMLASLAYLVTYSKALAKVNASTSGKNQNHEQDVLPGSSLGAAVAPRLFSLGKTKIRLD